MPPNKADETISTRAELLAWWLIIISCLGLTATVILVTWSSL